MFTKIAKKLFGGENETDSKSGGCSNAQSPDGRRRRTARSTATSAALSTRNRRLCIEPLESRELLAVYLVDSLNDGPITTTEMTLRRAMSLAQASPENDVIKFKNTGTIKLADVLSYTGTAGGELTIQGTGITIDGKNNQDCFVFSNRCDVDLVGLTIQNGKIGVNAGNASLEIVNCTVTQNENRGITTSGILVVSNSAIDNNRGGGIEATGPDAHCTVVGSSISLNRTLADGGGIYSSAGMFTVTNSTISDNRVGQTGGGIYHGGTDTTFVVSNSTVEGNIAEHGGGIYSDGGVDSLMTVLASSILKNIATDQGGGICTGDSDTTLVIVNSTIFGNHAEYGGGIYRGDSDSIYMVGSEVVGNLAPMEYIEDGGLRYYNTDSDNYGNCCTWEPATKTWSHLIGIHSDLPPSFPMPQINGKEVTAAVIKPVGKLQANAITTLDATGSVHAANYFWDLDGDGNFNDAIGAILTIGGAGVATGTVSISWEKLHSFGWGYGKTYTVSLKTVVAGSTAGVDEEDVLRYSIAEIDITVAIVGTMTYPDALPERMAKDTAYITEWETGQNINFGTGGMYIVDQIFGSANGFYAVGLINSITTQAVLAIRGTADIYGALADANPAGVGYNFYTAYKSVVDAWLDYASLANTVTVLGHSLGGALAQWFTSSYEGTIDYMYSFNATGISAAAAENFDAAQKKAQKKTVVTNYINDGDLVSMVGERFLTGTNWLYAYANVNILAKHSAPMTAKEIAGLKQPNYYSVKNISSATLNSIWFCSSRWEYYGTVAAASLLNVQAAQLVFRGSAEALRKAAGGLIVIPPYTTDAPKEIRMQVVPLNGGFSLRDTIVKWDDGGAISLSTNLATPFGFTLGGSIDKAPNGIHGISVRLKDMNIPIGPTLFLNNAELSVKNLHNENLPLTLIGTISVTVGPPQVHLKTPSWLGGVDVTASMVGITGTLEGSSEGFQIYGSAYVPKLAANTATVYLVAANGIFSVNWKSQIINFQGKIDAHIFNDSGQIFVGFGSSPILNTSIVAAIKIPAEVPFIGNTTVVGGTAELLLHQRLQNQTDTGYILALVKVWNHSLGFKYTFDSTKSFWQNLQFVGFGKSLRPSVQKTMLQAAATTEESRWMLDMTWSQSQQNATGVLVVPGEIRIPETEFVHYGIEVVPEFSSPTNRLYLIDPAVFNFVEWYIEIESGGVKIDDAIENLYEFTVPVEVAITDVAKLMDDDAVEVTLHVTGGYTPNTVLQFFVSTDELGEDATLLYETTVGQLGPLVDGIGKVSFVPSGIDAGLYHFFVVATEDGAVPAESFFGTEPIQFDTTAKLTVYDTDGSETDASVYFGSIVPTEKVLEQLVDEFTVKNTGTAPMSITNWKLDGVGNEVFTFEIYDNAGNHVGMDSFLLMPGESVRICVRVTAAKTANQRHVFTLVADTNDPDMPTLKLSGSVIFTHAVGVTSAPESGIVVSADNGGSYTVRLSTKPLADVIVYMDTNFHGLHIDDDEDNRLVFTPENWDTPQVVHISLDNIVLTQDAVALIFHYITSTDAAYLTGGIADVIVNISSQIKLATPVLGIVSATSVSQIAVNWTAVSHAAGYIIQYSTSSTFASGNHTKTVSDGTAITSILTGLTADMTYYIRIMATGADGSVYTDSEYSDARLATTFAVTSGAAVIQTVVRDTIAADNDMTYQEAVANRIASLNEWSHFTIDVWINAGSCGNILSFSTTTLQFDKRFFFVSNVEFGAGFSGTYSPSDGQVIILPSSADSSDSHDGRVFLFRVELEPAATPYPWENITPIASGLVFTTSTISIRSQPVGGNVSTTTTGISVPNNLKVSPVRYDLAPNQVIDLADFSEFIKQFGKVPSVPSADFNNDGVVNLTDFSMFIKAFGKTRDSGLKNPVAGEPLALVGGNLAAVLSAPIDDLAPSVSAGLEMPSERAADVAQRNRRVAAQSFYPPTTASTPPSGALVSSLTYVSGSVTSRAYDWVSESRIQSEEFYRRRFFEELAMETESDKMKISHELQTLEAVL